MEADLTESSISRKDDSLRIGGILVAAGKLSSEQAEEIWSLANAEGLRFGAAALKLKRITQSDIDFALARQFNYPVLLGNHPAYVSKELVLAQDPHAAQSESMRTIRSRIMLGWLEASERNVLAIVSPDRAEGRSWFAGNLAVAFAQAGERTLVIDCDMRNPRQHELFNIRNDVGLANALTGRAGIEIARRIDPKLRLFVVPSGPCPPNPQELLIKPVFDVVLAAFSRRVDVVVLDTPAATETGDAEVLATHAGASLLLARRDHTKESRMLSVMDSMMRSGVKVIGSVINEF